MNQKNSSPVANREFIWVAKYADGSELREYDGELSEENDFYAIDKAKLINFALIGHNYTFGFANFGGAFNLKGNLYTFVLRDGVNGRSYSFNKDNIVYRDIIQYKSAFNDFNPFNKNVPLRGSVYKHSIGYKGKLSLDGCEFGLKFLLHIPFNEPVNFETIIMPDRDISGSLNILKNGKLFGDIKRDFEKDRHNKITWVLR